MASFKKTSMSTKSSNKPLANRCDLPGKLQSVATGIFIAGFAGAVAASRIMPPTNAGSSVYNHNDSLAMMNNAGNHAANNAKVHAAINESKQLMQDLLHTLDEARLDGGKINQESMKRARNIARSLAAINNISQANSIKDMKLLGMGSCAAPAEAALVHLSTGQYSLSSGIVIRIQGISGTEEFSFASGLSQASIINAINSFSKTLGVEAEQSGENPARVEVRSIEVGADSLIRMWGNAVVFTQATGGPALDDLKDYGKNAITLQAIQDKP